MGIFSEKLGYYKLTVDGEEYEIRPKVGDVRRFLKIISSYESTSPKLFDEVFNFIYDLFKREYKPATREDEEELQVFVERNLIPLIGEVMIAFKLTTREDWEQRISKTVEESFKKKD